MGREFLQYKTHGKSQQNKHTHKTNTTQFEDLTTKFYYNNNNVFREE